MEVEVPTDRSDENQHGKVGTVNGLMHHHNSTMGNNITSCVKIWGSGLLHGKRQMTFTMLMLMLLLLV